MTTEKWREEFDKEFGDKFNNVEGNSKIIATGIGLKYIYVFIEELLSKERNKVLDEVKKEVGQIEEWDMRGAQNVESASHINGYNQCLKEERNRIESILENLKNN